MKYLMTTTLAITFMAFGFASIATTPAQAEAQRLESRGTCFEKEQMGEAEYRARYGHTRCNIASSDITDVESLAETAQGGDRDGDVGGGDFGGESDRAAASTAAE